MAEFTSYEERKRTIAILRNDIKSVFPEIRAFVGVDLGGGSGLTISAYDDMEAADRAVEKRKKRMAGEGFSDNFSHEGKVIAFYADKEQIDNLVQSVS